MSWQSVLIGIVGTPVIAYSSPGSIRAASRPAAPVVRPSR
jgi:hypothetical protein